MGTFHGAKRQQRGTPGKGGANGGPRKERNWKGRGETTEKKKAKGDYTRSEVPKGQGVRNKKKRALKKALDRGRDCTAAKKKGMWIVKKPP